MGVVSQVADRVNVMYAGEIVERAPADRLFANPAHPYTRGLLASIPSVREADEELLTADGEVPTPNAPPTSCRFAPRCPKAFDACESVSPGHVALDGGQSAACLLFEERLDPPDPPERGLPGAADAGDQARTDGGDE